MDSVTKFLLNYGEIQQSELDLELGGPLDNANKLLITDGEIDEGSVPEDIHVLEVPGGSMDAVCQKGKEYFSMSVSSTPQAPPKVLIAAGSHNIASYVINRVPLDYLKENMEEMLRKTTEESFIKPIKGLWEVVKKLNGYLAVANIIPIPANQLLDEDYRTFLNKLYFHVNKEITIFNIKVQADHRQLRIYEVLQFRGKTADGCHKTKKVLYENDLRHLNKEGKIQITVRCTKVLQTM